MYRRSVACGVWKAHIKAYDDLSTCHHLAALAQGRMPPHDGAGSDGLCGATCK